MHLWVLFVLHGFPVKRVPRAVLRSAFCFGYHMGALSYMAIMVKNKVCTATKERFKMYIDRTKEIVFILMILILTWSLGSVCKALGTASFIISIYKQHHSHRGCPCSYFHYKSNDLTCDRIFVGHFRYTYTFFDYNVTDVRITSLRFYRSSSFGRTLGDY